MKYSSCILQLPSGSVPQQNITYARYVTAVATKIFCCCTVEPAVLQQKSTRCRSAVGTWGGDKECMRTPFVSTELLSLELTVCPASHRIREVMLVYAKKLLPLGYIYVYGREQLTGRNFLTAVRPYAKCRSKAVHVQPVAKRLNATLLKDHDQAVKAQQRD